MHLHQSNTPLSPLLPLGGQSPLPHLYVPHGSVGSRQGAVGPVPVTNSRQLKWVGCDSSRMRLGDSSPRHGDRPTRRRARARVTRANFPSNVERCGEDQYFAIQPSEGQRYSSPSANHRVWPLTEGGGGRVILLEVPQLLDEAVNHTHRIKAVQPGQHLTLCPLYSGGQEF